jgi:23S rRNA (guanosine2251-2'-O)-methyltransferase
MTQSRPPRSKNARPVEKPKHEAPRRFEGPKLSLPGRKPEPKPERPTDRPPMRERGQRAPAVPNGAVWLYGTHAVAAALGNPARRLRRLVLSEDAQAALATERPMPWPIQPEIVGRDRIDQLLGARPGSGIVHQGVALLTDQLVAPPLLDALKRPGPILVLDQISDPRNIGALMRTAQAFGAAMVIAQERNAPEETGALAKVASGALELIPLLRIVNISRALIVLKSANVWVVGLDGTAPGRLDGAAFAGRRVALVLGNEGEGMRRLTRETCDEVLALGMPGGMESLNVSAAGAVALYELTRGA